MRLLLFSSRVYPGRMGMEGEFNHPYIPRDLRLPGFVPGFLSQSTILAVYGISSLLVVSFMWILSGRYHKTSKVDRILMCWWIFTGLTHIILEGYFVFSPEFYKEKAPHYLAEVWKEYSKGDSRYRCMGLGVIPTSSFGNPSLRHHGFTYSTSSGETSNARNEDRLVHLESQLKDTLNAFKTYIIMKEGSIPDELVSVFNLPTQPTQLFPVESPYEVGRSSSDSNQQQTQSHR